MNKYTVIGVYDDNLQRFADWVEAASAEEAEAKVIERLREDGIDSLIVAGVADGHLEMKA